MLGPPKSRRLDQPIAVSLEELVPASNFYRHLDAKLDLSFIRAWTRELNESGHTGVARLGIMVVVPYNGRSPWLSAPPFSDSCSPTREPVLNYEADEPTDHHGTTISRALRRGCRRTRRRRAGLPPWAPAPHSRRSGHPRPGSPARPHPSSRCGSR